MKRQIVIGLLLIILLGAIVISAAAGSLFNDFRIAWWTVGSGGGRVTGGTFDLNGTAGQPDAGKHTGGTFALNGGFWYADISTYHVYLPAMIKN